MKRRAATLSAALAGLICLASLLFAAPGGAQEPAPSISLAAQDLLTRANLARTAHGLSALRIEEHLSAMAQRRAEEQARAGMLVRSLDSMGLLERTQAAGYEAHSIAELLASTSSGIPELFAEWEQGSSKSYRALLAPEAKDLGAGSAKADGVTYVSLLVGLSLPDFFRQQTAGLRDLAEMRQEMLAATNAARKEAHRVALTLEPHLIDCAQKYARLMLQTSHYGHLAPDGTTVRERAQAAGYGEFTALGENIAQGQFSVAEVMDGWLHSPAHRENLLSPLYRDVGFGVAFGHDANGWEVLWVQCFGSPR